MTVSICPCPRAGDAYDHGPYVIAALMEVPEDEDLNGGTTRSISHWLRRCCSGLGARSTSFVSQVRAGWTRVEAKGPGGRAPKYLALHEWTGPEAVGTDEFKHAVGTEWSARVKEYATIFDIRTFKFLKSWERV